MHEPLLRPRRRAGGRSRLRVRARHQGRRDDRGRAGDAPRRRVPRRLRLRARRHRRPPPSASRRSRRTSPRSSRSSVPALDSLLAGADERDLTKLAEYRAIGGYKSIEKARAMAPDDLIAELQESNLRGRGGAGFPMGRKASLIDRDERQARVPRRQRRRVGAGRLQGPRGDEPRPAPARSRAASSRRTRSRPSASSSTSAASTSRSTRSSRRPWTRRAKAGVFGSCDILVHRGAGAYICGEETALLDSLEGRRGQPRARPPFPPVQGLYDAPTQINNVCTIATVPIIIELGAAEFAKIGSRVVARHGDLLDLGQHRAARQLRARARHADARARLRHRRRRPGRARS